MLAEQHGGHEQRVRHRHEQHPRSDRAGRREERPADHQRTPDEEHAGLAEPVMLEADRRGDVEHRHEQAGQREDDDQRPAHGREGQHDRGPDRVDDQDRRLELPLRHPARQDRVWRIQGPDVALGVDATGRIEVVVDHVVGGVCQHEADDGDLEEAPVDRRTGRDPVRLDGQQPPDEPRPDRHREDGCSRDDEPLADRVERPRNGRVRGLEDLLPGEEALAKRDVGDWRDGRRVHAILEARKRARPLYHVPARPGGAKMPGCLPSRRSGPPGSSSSRCRCRSWRPCSGAIWPRQST